MIKELTNEEKVTKLLIRNDILNNKKSNNTFLGENYEPTLGEFLLSIPPELTPINPDEFKYVFINK